MTFTLLTPNPNPSRVTDPMWWFWEQLHKLEPASQLGGIIANKSGYHGTRAANIANWPGNYSIVLPLDLQGPSDKAAAVDWTFPDAQSARYATIIKYSARLLWSGQDLNDPRGNYLREFYGQADLDTAVEGWDFQAVGPRSSDASHLWHIHFSFMRAYVNNYDAMVAVLSILKGETVAQWKAGLTVKPSIEENPMLIVKETDRPEVYLTDGFKYRHLTPESLLRLQAVLNSRGLNSAITNVPAGHVRAGYLGDLEVKPPTADDIADAVVAKLPAPGGSYTLTDVKEAVKAALREGTAV